MKAIIKYFKKRKQAIRSLLDTPRQEYTLATFHDLRVEIKKLDALFELINFCSKNFNRKKTFKYFKLIFDQAGKVREIQVEETILKKYYLVRLLKEYRNRLNEHLLKEKEDYFSISNKNFIARMKKMNHKIIPFLDRLDKNKANRYMKKRRKQIKKLLNQSSIQTSQVHDLRKRLKKFNDNRKCLDMEKQYKPLPKEDILPDLLGRWHDSQMILRHLNKAIDNVKTHSKEGRQLENIKAKISSTNKVLFKKINTAIAAS